MSVISESTLAIEIRVLNCHV